MMKISKRTLELLKNFSQINSNILIREGNVLSTLSAQNLIFARATVDEHFPQEFAIYDLNSLLGILTLGDDQEIAFGEKSLTVSKDNGKFEYYYADPSIIHAPPNKNPNTEPHFEFGLGLGEISTIQKAIGITGATTISVVADGTNAMLVVGDPETSCSNSYQKLLGQTDMTFDCRLGISKFKPINDTYTCAITTRKYLYMSSTSRDLKYWMALDLESTI